MDYEEAAKALKRIRATTAARETSEAEWLESILDGAKVNGLSKEAIGEAANIDRTTVHRLIKNNENNGG